ncbi:hypothetical protein IB277_31100 [Ensifer sp. ENS07]|uniref:hypothetical protein n=1 Tax=Ensifer sp. ENS07 TaxID=2769274 RepID=UPI001783EE53|nr:hypothetical protein [Ensifer sp. ENS07]MBD9640747.1 hypothetical protein [Ensifer sp. ENS07]
MKLIANRHLTYGTRRLIPGDAFEAPDREARVLIAVNKAAPAGAGAQKRSGRASAPADDLAALRKKYQEVSGKRPFNGWDAETLRSKIVEEKDAN